MKKLIKVRLCKFAFCIVLILNQSCTKTTTGELMYAKTETPKTITAGQPINSKVRLQFWTTSIQIDFQGFQTKEMSTHHYSINALAKFTTNGQTSANAAYWLMDTTYTIHTVNPGQYILNFVYSNDIFKSDTVVVQQLTEELICRGVLLYILIKKVGTKWAIITTSVAFGLLHWLNNGIFGNLIQMSIIFAFTFGMGLLLAYSYGKTFSILIPTAIHFGWNLTQNFIFPEQPQGNHIFILLAPPPVVAVSYFIFFLLLLFPKVSAIGLDYLIIKKQEQIEPPK